MMIRFVCVMLCCLSSWAVQGQEAVTASGETTLHVTITDLRNTKGKVMVSLYRHEHELMGKPWLTHLLDISEEKEAATAFTDLPAGNYAVAVFHDKNENGELDTNFLGIPKEGYGWSNNPKPTFRAARYDECVFTIAQSEQSVAMTIEII